VAARSGVVIKGIDALERGYRATDILFDKTGTLTKDDLSVVHEHIAPVPNLPQHETEGLVKALVTGNNHPVSIAINRYLADRSLPELDMEEIQSVPGFGIQGSWNGHDIKAGSPHWLSLTSVPAVIEILERRLTAFAVTVDGEFVLVYGLRGSTRDDAPAVIRALQRKNIRCHIVSGDNEKAVQDVATDVDIDPANVLARCSPKQKRDYVEHLQSSGRVVLFCGDGTNDAVAVAQANIGMQIGTASDVTKGVCDVTLLGGLDGILFFLDVSKRSFRRIRFNFVWSAVYNVFAILLASGALVKFRIPPAYAGLGEIVSVAPVVLAAMTLIWVKQW
jgi:Cd2+-exporting ATPase